MAVVRALGVVFALLLVVASPAGGAVPTNPIWSGRSSAAGRRRCAGPNRRKYEQMNPTQHGSEPWLRAGSAVK
jgi:hypothetical protein